LKIILTCAICLTLIAILLQPSHTLADPVERTVGVEVGDRIKYGNLIGFWAPPVGMPDWVAIMNESQSFEILVESISGTKITCQETWSFKNGTEIVFPYYIDIVTAEGAWQMQVLFISANLQKGDSIFANPWGWYIKETLWRTYLGVAMEVNQESGSIEIWPNVEHSFNYYWEKTTGVLCEHQEAFVNKTSGDTIMFYSYEIVDSNIFPPTGVRATIYFDPDTLSLKSNGEWITAYIELPEGYNVGDIDIATIMLNNTISADLTAPIEIDDYDMDGISDLMVKFRRAEVTSLIHEALRNNGWRSCNVMLSVAGKLLDRTLFEGSDTIKVIARAG